MYDPQTIDEQKPLVHQKPLDGPAHGYTRVKSFRRARPVPLGHGLLPRAWSAPPSVLETHAGGRRSADETPLLRAPREFRHPAKQGVDDTHGDRSIRTWVLVSEKPWRVMGRENR